MITCTAGSGVFTPPHQRDDARPQNRKFKPTLITLALVVYEPIRVPADGLLE